MNGNRPKIWFQRVINYFITSLDSPHFSFEQVISGIIYSWVLQCLLVVVGISDKIIHHQVNSYFLKQYESYFHLGYAKTIKPIPPQPYLKVDLLTGHLSKALSNIVGSWKITDILCKQTSNISNFSWSHNIFEVARKKTHFEVGMRKI